MKCDTDDTSWNNAKMKRPALNVTTANTNAIKTLLTFFILI